MAAAKYKEKPVFRDQNFSHKNLTGMREVVS